MQSVLSRIWTRVAVSISYDDSHYTTSTSTIFANFTYLSSLAPFWVYFVIFYVGNYFGRYSKTFHRILCIKCQTIQTRNFIFHIYFAYARFSPSDFWPICISTTSSNLNPSCSIHFSTCICGLEISIRPTSRHQHFLLHNSLTISNLQ